MSDTTTPKPAINDAFWFKYSESFVNSGVENYHQGAAKIQSFILWLWGIHTTLVTVGVSLAGKSIPLYAKLLMVAASVLLICVYWATVWVQIPSKKLVKFDPRRPDQIRLAYNQIIKNKSTRLAITSGLSIFAALAVGLSVVLASVFDDKPMSAPQLNAALISEKGKKSKIMLTASVGKAKKVVVSVATNPPLPKNAQHEWHLVPTEAGMIQTDLPLEVPASQATLLLIIEKPEQTTLSIAQKLTASSK